MSNVAAVNPEIEKQLEACGWAAYLALQRYGLLIGTLRRVNLLQERFPGKQVYNSTALQPFYDSFDMLVIDLCSAAKAWLDTNSGLFKHLTQSPELLRRRSADDFGGGNRGRTIAESVNETIAKLVPHENPVGPADIERWQKAFDEATRRVRNDRNKVRAHRYEVIRGEADPGSHAISLEEYTEHVKYLVDHVHQASMAIKATSFDTEIKVPETEAADLADLIFHGSIDGAIWAYRLVCRAASKEPPQQFEELRESAMALLKDDPSLYERAFDGSIEDP